jgi:hypothetical protein
VHVRVLERGADDGDDLLALARPYHHGDVAVRGDPPVSEKRAERADGPAADLDRQRARDQAG